ncbi:MAG TPA: capsule biosynthesis protein CapA [Rhodospirillaceae bacterium]|nr:capsule biosynthesis protein CapA [Rhodospirillaceae bacterium]HAA92428.1 capsule biosynthesis protein CapA [Rhodospirillaceae bacterium]HAT36100.1 capsule biosynthesis protein CapA [Rhodospirillaceae bacterium]
MTANRDFSFVTVGQSLIKRDLRSYENPAFWECVEILRAGDVSFTNLEATIKGAHGGWPTKATYVGTAEALVLDNLKEFGFDMLSLANNHAFDLGPPGVLSTMEETAARGFCFAGLGRDLSHAAEPGFGELEMGKVALVAIDAGPCPPYCHAKDADEKVAARPGLNFLRVASEITLLPEQYAAMRGIHDELGHQRLWTNRRTGGPSRHGGLYDDYVDFYGVRLAEGDGHHLRGVIDEDDLARIEASIEKARAAADFVVVYLHHHHWEAEWEDVPDWHRRFAHACIDAGAHAYVSHGVPILLGLEIYKKAPIFYSLGNFIFHSFAPTGWFHDDVWCSVIASCDFAADGVLKGVRIDPIAIGGSEALAAGDFEHREAPHLARDDKGTETLERYKRVSAEFGTDIVIADYAGTVTVA